MEISNTPLETIIEFFNGKQLESDPIRLNQCTVIENQERFLASHIATLRANSGKKKFVAYYDRLNQFYHIKKKQWEQQKN